MKIKSKVAAKTNGEGQISLSTLISDKRPVRRSWVALIVPTVVVAALLVVAYVVFDQTGIGLGVLAQTLALMLLALGWNLAGGYAGQPAFGHGAFFGLGAYVTVLLAIHFAVPPIVGIWAGAAVGMLAAFIVGTVSLRFREIYFALASTAFPLILGTLFTYFGLQEVSFPFKLHAGVLFLGFGSEQLQVAIGGTAVLAAVLLSAVVERSRLGLLLRTIRADERAAAACGVAVWPLKVGVLVLSAGVSAVAGALYAVSVLVITPDSFFGLLLSLAPAIFTLVGGSGTVLGPVIGAGLLVPLQNVIIGNFGAAIPGIAPLVYGVAVVIVVLAFPGGIYSQILRLEPMARRVLRRSAAAGAAAVATTTPNGLSPAAVGADHPQAASRPGPLGNILEIAGVTKSFGGLEVLKDVSFEVRNGEILGVIGPNGAGKTTLFDIVSGFVRADEGSVKLQGKELLGLPSHRVCRAGLGRTFQTPRLFWGLTVRETVAVAAQARMSSDRVPSAIDDALGVMKLSPLAAAPVEKLTTGEVRRLELARAVVGRPDVVLLDEFLGGIGVEEAQLVLNGLRAVRERGSTIVAIEHTMHAMAAFVDRFVVLNLGRVCAEGTASEISSNPEVLEAYLGARWMRRVSS